MNTYTLTPKAKYLILLNNGLRNGVEMPSFDEQNMSDNEFFAYVMDLLSINTNKTV